MKPSDKTKKELTLEIERLSQRVAELEGGLTGPCGTELEITVKRLNESQRLARLGNWDWDITNNRLYWSDEIYRIFGFKPQEFGATYEAFLNSVHPDDRGFVRKSVDDALTLKRPYEIDHRIILPDGTERIVREKAEAQFDAEGKAIRMTGTVQDITERKKTEDELLKAKKLESIGEFAGGIAHDFNNHLMGILGNVSIGKNYLKEDERLFWILSQIEKAALRTKDLTKQFLTFSRGGGPVRETANVERIIKDSAALVLKGTDIECVFHVKNGVKQVDVDIGQITQVFNNVILNAKHAMGGKGRMDITVENAADAGPVPGGDYVKITVEDTGPGISEDALPKIFDPFFTTKEKASGLGLAISYSIVQRHGGSISAISKDGKGAAFFICLPAGAARAANHAGKERARPFVKGGVIKGKVLVMDDEEVVRDVSGEMLNLMGYDAEFAADGKTAVEMYKKAFDSGAPFAAVVMDLTVPGGMGGKEAMEKLLEIDPQVKAVVSSGYSKDPIMSDFTKYGFSAVIAKPYRVADFSKVVKGVVEKT
ncbi:MAG: PAS domain-containing protein [Deltaproteobacteria bacterium]|nr:PAS domain-containing protein [Deltaproteobacteria bacterium]